MKQNYHAITLDKRDIGERDRLYTFYTMEHGLMRVPARSIRKIDAKLSSQVEDFTLAHITVAKNFGRGTLAGAVTEECYEGMRKNYDALMCVDAARNIFLSIIDENAQDVRVFNLFVQYLREVDDIAHRGKKSIIDMHWITNAFLINLFSLQGYTFDTSHCSVCRGNFEKRRNGFSAHHGGLICVKCLSGGGYCYVDVDTVKAMRVIQGNDFSLLRKVRIHDDVHRQMSSVVQNIAQWVTR